MATLKAGTEILTTKSNGSTDWVEGAEDARRWNTKGMIIGHHDSHGLVYCVAHFCSGMDGGKSSIAYYEPGEFEVLPPRPHQPNSFFSPKDFPVADELPIQKDGEGINAYQKRVVIAQFTTRYLSCKKTLGNREDNADKQAGDPMIYHCKHCGMISDILPEDFFLVNIRTVCSLCEPILPWIPEALENIKQITQALKFSGITR